MCPKYFFIFQREVDFVEITVDFPDNLNKPSKKAKFYSNVLKKLDQFDSITYICASDKDIKHLIACKQKMFGACNEEHFFNRLLRCDRFKQKTTFISLNNQFEFKDDKYYEFPSQLGEYVNLVCSIKGYLIKLVVLFLKYRLQTIIKNSKE